MMCRYVIYTTVYAFLIIYSYPPSTRLVYNIKLPYTHDTPIIFTPDVCRMALYVYIPTKISNTSELYII